MIGIIFEALACLIPDFLLVTLDWRAAKDAKARGKKRHIPPTWFVIMALIIVAIPIVAFRMFGSWSLFGIPSNQLNEMEEIVRALDSYKNSFGSYPENLSSIIDGIPLRNRWLKDYWGQAYAYNPYDEGKRFEVRSAGRDKTMNTEDDLVRKSSKDNNPN